MSDQSDVPAVEPEEAAQDAVTEPASTPPWGDDFDAERAWKTIQNLRQFEKQAKEFERIQSDEDARTEWLKSQGYVLEDAETPDSGEDDLEFEDDEPQGKQDLRDPRVDEILKREEARAIRADLDKIGAGSEWELDDHDRMVIEAWARQDKKGFDRDALERAHGKYVERLEAIAAKGVERAKKPKPKPPHNLPGGSAATQVPDLDNTQERHRWLQEQVASRSSQ